jgi:CheY-like chemotaxis protein
MPKKLLVADDSLTIQKVIRLALSGAASGASDGYEIQTVSDGNDAIQQVSLFRPDVVLIDVSLPGKSAFEVKRSTNQHRDLGHVRFVLMSSAFEKVDEVQVEEVGFDGRLTKPFDPAHLRDVLAQVLAKAPPAPPSASASTPPAPPSDFPDFEPTMTLAPPPPRDTEFPDLPPLPESFETNPEPENDIRNLTESTIRMSGLADLANEKPPELPPNFPPEPPSEFPEDFQWSVEERSLKPPMHLDAGDSTFPLAPPSKIPNEHSRFIQNSKPDELELTPPPPPAPGMPNRGDTYEAPPAPPAPSFDPSQFEGKIEEMVRREVSNALRRVAQENLADAVERIVKEEIHKLLQDSP